MKPLNEVCPDPKELLELGPVKLGEHVLVCLEGTGEPHVERATIVKTLSANYHQDVQHEIAHAIEQAIDWLLAQCVLGASPSNQDLISLTRPVEKEAETEHPTE